MRLVNRVVERYIEVMHVQPGPRTGAFILQTHDEDGAQKFDDKKNRLDLLPFEALEEIGWVMTYGAKKYAPHNWRKGMATERVIGAALRHIFSWAKGDKIDPESGRSHLAHAVCMLLFAITFEQQGKK